MPGRTMGLVPGGYRAIESLRLEKGYRVWGTDITPETTPYEAGLGFSVHWDKPGGFVGRRRCCGNGMRGSGRRLCCLSLDDPPRSCSAASRSGTTTGGRPGDLGWLRVQRRGVHGVRLPAADAWDPGQRVEVEMFGRRIPATVVSEPVYDPAGSRVRGDYS